MLIFSRNRGPVVTMAFILIVCAATLVKCQVDIEKENEAEARDEVLFVPFQQEFAKVIGADSALAGSRLLFEFFRCGTMSVTEKVYCNRKSDEVYQALTEKQRQDLVPLFKKYFPK